MKQPVTRELYAYWDTLRQGRAAPERCDIDPAAIRRTLADTFIVEVQGGMTSYERAYPVRLSGTRVNALFLRELKGSSLLDWWRTEDQATAHGIMACVLDERAAMVAGVRAAPRGHTPLDLELLLLPLRHRGKTHSRVLGSLAPAWPATWQGLLAVEPMTILSFRHVACAGSPPMPRPSPLPLPSSLPFPAARSGGTPARHGRFLVYEGGR